MHRRVFVCLLLALVLSGCGIYPFGSPEFTESDYDDLFDMLVYEDSKVHDYEKDKKEEEVSCSTEDDMDDVEDFYDDFLDDESDEIVLISKEADRDEISIEGIYDGVIFEVEAEEAEGRLERKYDTTITIKIEELDEDEIKEILESLGITEDILDDEKDKDNDEKIEIDIFGSDKEDEDEEEESQEKTIEEKLLGYWIGVEYTHEAADFDVGDIAIEFTELTVTIYLVGEENETYEYFVENDRIMYIKHNGVVDEMNLMFNTMDGVEYLVSYEYDDFSDETYYVYYEKN